MTTRKRIYLAIAIITLIGLGNVLAQTQFKDQRSRAPRQHELEHDSRARSQACAAVLRFTSARHGFARRWHRTGNRCARGNENSAAVGVARTHLPSCTTGVPQPSTPRYGCTTAKPRGCGTAIPVSILHSSSNCSTSSSRSERGRGAFPARGPASRPTSDVRRHARRVTTSPGPEITRCGRQACNQKR